jgi:hypothetical protein
MMTKHSWTLIRLCLVIALIVNFNAAAARADDASKERDFRLSVTESFSPIGKLHSFGGARINGRQTDGEQSVWAGDMIEAPPNSSVRVSLNSIGRITLKGSAIARLATAYEMTEQNADRRVLVAWVLKGDMAAQLDADVSAYVEARGSGFSSSAGASFRITSREGLVVADAAIGAIWAVSSLPQEYRLQRVTIDRGRLIDLGNREIKKRRREPEPFSVRLTGRKPPTRTVAFTSGPGAATGATPQDLDPISDEPVEFELISDNPNIRLGTLSSRGEPTNKDGIASTTFFAGNNSGTGKLRVTVPRLGITQDWQVIVVSGPVLTRNRILIGAAALVGAIIIVDPWSGDGEIKQLPPPVIP